jgi:hypothetical protein
LKPFFHIGTIGFFVAGMLSAIYTSLQTGFWLVFLFLLSLPAFFEKNAEMKGQFSFEIRI